MSNPSATPSPARKKSPLFRLVAVLVVLAGAVWLLRFAHRSYVFEETDDAYLQGHIHLVSARLPGTVQEVLVKENETVRAGQPLARLDAAPLLLAKEKAAAALAEAQAQRAQAEAAVQQAQAGAAQARAQVAQAEAQVQETGAQREVADVNFNRSQRLFQGDVRAVSKSEVDTSKSSADAGRAALTGSRAGLEAARARVLAEEAAAGAAQAQLLAAEAGVSARAAALREAELDLSYGQIAAPAAGRIGNKNVETGNRVQAGQALFAVVAPDVWVQANFKETQLRRMRPGQPVELSVDAVDGRTFTGRVESVSPATGAQFALLPADNATGNFTKVVQRVPVKIVFDPESIRGVEDRLQPGLSTVVSVHIR